MKVGEGAPAELLKHRANMGEYCNFNYKLGTVDMAF